MKVLYQIRPEYNTAAAGDSIQMLQTKSHMEKLGVEIDISCQPEIDLRPYHLVHLFNVTRFTETYGFYKNAVRQNKKIVVSPIFIDMREYYKEKDMLKLANWRGGNPLRREILEGSDCLLPNSQKEKGWIENVLCVNTPQRVVYNGVDPHFAKGSSKSFIQEYGLRDFILCVGRIAPIKNQLALIKAVKDLPVKLVLIGPINDRKYAQRCLEEAGENVFFIHQMDHEKLASAYKAAKVHVQPSWFETAGLASLEAGCAGIQVVVTDRGAAKEYFGDMAWYCSPEKIESIRTAVWAAYNAPYSIKLQKRILESYTWENSARGTMEAYQRTLDSNERRYEQVKKQIFHMREYPI